MTNDKLKLLDDYATTPTTVVYELPTRFGLGASRSVLAPPSPTFYTIANRSPDIQKSTTEALAIDRIIKANFHYASRTSDAPTLVAAALKLITTLEGEALRPYLTTTMPTQLGAQTANGYDNPLMRALVAFVLLKVWQIDNVFPGEFYSTVIQTFKTSAGDFLSQFTPIFANYDERGNNATRS